VRSYRANGIDHKVYDEDDEMPLDLLVLKDWRVGQVGEWVMTDDCSVIQILRRGKMLRRMGKDKVREYVGTCTGTFPVSETTEMDTVRRDDIYSFGGKKAKERMIDKKNLSNYEQKFVALMSAGIPPEDAYLQAFPTENRKYAFEKSGTLVKTERIKTAMKEELKPVLEELGINETSVLENINNIALTSEKDETRLKALFKLSDIMDLEDKSKTNVQQLTGAVFQGFDETMIETAERPKEISK